MAETALWHKYLPEGGKDRYNRPISGFAGPVTIAVRGFDPGTSSEPRAGTSRRVNAKPTLYLRRDPGIGSMDEFSVRGVRYEVEGEDGVWVSPYSGRLAGCEVTLRKVTG